MNTFAAHIVPVRSAIVRVAVFGMLATFLSPRALRSQTDGICIPVAERAGRAFGCFITARQELGRLPSAPALYWHLDTYPTRAAAVAAWLVAHGIDAARLSSNGFGQMRPIAPNLTEKGRRTNRRVEFMIVDEPARSTTP